MPLSAFSVPFQLLDLDFAAAENHPKDLLAVIIPVSKVLRTLRGLLYDIFGRTKLRNHRPTSSSWGFPGLLELKVSGHINSCRTVDQIILGLTSPY